MSDQTKKCTQNCNTFISTNSQIRSYGPTLITLDPRRSWEWFKIWVVLILIIIIVFCLIAIVDAPLNKYDLMNYVSKKETRPIQVNISSYSSLSPEELRQIDLGLIPNVTDFSENNYK